MGSQRTPDPRLRRLEPTPSPNPSSSLTGPQEARGLRRRPFPREAPGWHGQRLSSWGLWAPRCPRGVEGPLEGAGSLQPESPEPPRNFGSDLEHFLPGRPGAIRGGLLRADAALLWAGPATCGPCSARWPGWLCSVPRALWLQRHHQGAEQQKKCERQAAKSQKGEDGREDRGAPGDRGERPVGPAGGAGLEPAPRTLQPGPRPPRRRWLLSPGAGAQQLEVVPLPGSTL
ncbi:placenta-specific protein 9 isoform X3 [Callithrix jacchus]